MDVCQELEAKLDTVTSTCEAVRSDYITELEGMIAKFKGIREQLRAEGGLEGVPCTNLDLVSPVILEGLQIALKELPSTVNKLGVCHREQHKGISKVGRIIDKGFTAELALGSLEGRETVEVANLRKDILGGVITRHFYHEGMTAVGDNMVEEMECYGDVDMKKDAYEQVNRVMADLKNNTVHSALVWAMANREALLERRSTLEFKLHRFIFIKILLNSYPPESRKKEAIAYAQLHFQAIGDRHAKEIQTLMGALLYSKSDGLSTTQSFPDYRKLIDYVDSVENWTDLHCSFLRDASAVLGIPQESSLDICVSAGCNVLPYGARGQMRSSLVDSLIISIWRARENRRFPSMEVPFQSFNYHSVFVCPILREPTTRRNCPVRLFCGHVISQKALIRLYDANRMYKCPYCPGLRGFRTAKVIAF